MDGNGGRPSVFDVGGEDREEQNALGTTVRLDMNGLIPERMGKMGKTEVKGPICTNAWWDQAVIARRFLTLGRVELRSRKP
jgi:hypothetical protein